MDENEKSADELLAEAVAEITILQSENSKLKKRLQELEHIRQLDMASIVELRRRIELLEVECEI